MSHDQQLSAARNSAIPWQEIDTVLLDMDGTLLDLHYDNHFWLELLPSHYAARNKLCIEETRQRLRGIFQSTIGTLEFYCVDYWSKELDLDIVALKASSTERIGFLPDAERFLRALRQLPRAPKVAMATNAHRKVYEIKNRILSLDQYFDGVYCANEFDAPKESALYWQRLQDNFPFNPATTLFVDDNEAVLQSAKDYGIAHLWMPLNPDTQKPQREALVDFQPLLSLADITPDSNQQQN